MKLIKVEPVITEKTILLAKEHGIYTFKAPVSATKEDIKRYFKDVFGYKVVKLRVVHVPGKQKRNLLTRKRYTKKGYKKFYIEFADKVKFKGFA